MPDARQPSDLIHSAAIHLLRTVASADRSAAVGRAGLSALSVLVYAGPLSLAGLADAEGVRPATMSAIVDRLETDGLVERSPDAHDRRRVRLSATPEGRALFERARRKRLELLERLFADAPEADRATLARAAEIIEEAVAGRRPKAPPRSDRTS